MNKIQIIPEARGSVRLIKSEGLALIIIMAEINMNRMLRIVRRTSAPRTNRLVLETNMNRIRPKQRGQTLRVESKDVT